jgi:hypothetical protein
MSTTNVNLPSLRKALRGSALMRTLIRCWLFDTAIAAVGPASHAAVVTTTRS